MRFKLPIIEQKIIAEKTLEVSFGVPQKDFNFLAGQYVRVSIPMLLHPDPKGVSRLFSIASSPNEKNKITMAFRDSGSGFKRTLMELPLNSPVDVEGPFGYFTLPQKPSLPIVYIAGGIGITPCISMIRFAEEENLVCPATILYANANKESAAYLEELTAIAEWSPHFTLHTIFGRINADYIKKTILDIRNPMWFVVGPPHMVAEVRELLSRLGVDDAKIYFEDFEGY